MNAAKLLFVLGGLLIVTGIFLIGCSDQPETSFSPVSVMSDFGISENTEVVLYAGQDIPVGHVSASFSGDDLCFEYVLDGDWELVETHLWAGTNYTHMPQTNKGNPKIGLFPYASGDITGDQSWMICIPITDLTPSPCEELLYVAAHAAVRLPLGNDEYQTETAWGDGDRMVDRGNWATYYSFTITCGSNTDVFDEFGCETAFAFGEYATCFLDLGLDINRWGWTIGPLTEQTDPYTFDLWAGAGQCNLSNGTLVGSVTVAYDGTTATVTYETVDPFELHEVQIFVGNEILPRDNNDEFTVAPGQYGYVDDELGGVMYYQATFDITGEIYVVAHAVVCVPDQCNQYGATFSDFSGMPTTKAISSGATGLVDVTLSDGKTVAIQATNISSAQFNFNGGPLSTDFWQDSHSVYGDLNLTGTTSRMNTRCLNSSGSASGVMPNSYTLTWDFGDTPLDHTNFFFIGQFWRPQNVATITAYDADGVVVANTAFGFEWLPAISGTYTFTEPLTWNPTAGTLAKTTSGDGPNSGYGFFSIPEGTEIGKIVFDLDDTQQTGTADELNWGIGSYGCID